MTHGNNVYSSMISVSDKPLRLTPRLEEFVRLYSQAIPVKQIEDMMKLRPGVGKYYLTLAKNRLAIPQNCNRSVALVRWWLEYNRP